MSSISSDSRLKGARPEPMLWALVDCNNFFVSCELVFRPDLKGRPVVVLSSNDGCIVARSPEAKALGIGMGVPEFRVRPILRANRVQVFSSNYALYADMSARVMATLAGLCPEICQYSIDEAFIPLSGALAKDAFAVAQTLRRTVLKWTGITVSVGVAPTRTLAKAANHMAKQGPGVVVLDRAADLPALLERLPVGEVWGIGRRLAAKLAFLGVSNARVFASQSDEWIQRHCTIGGLRTARELRGMPALAGEHAPAPRHTLVVSRSFGEQVRDLPPLAQAVATFTARAAERLRKAGLAAGGVGVHIRSSLYTGAAYNASGQKRLSEATNDTGLLQGAALSVLRALYRQGPAYAKAGVLVFELTDAARGQYALFPEQSEASTAQRAALMQAMDAINRKMGRETLRLGAAGPRDAGWHVRQDRVSPRATTAWDELPKAFCR